MPLCFYPSEFEPTNVRDDDPVSSHCMDSFQTFLSEIHLVPFLPSGFSLHLRAGDAVGSVEVQIFVDGVTTKHTLQVQDGSGPRPLLNPER